MADKVLMFIHGSNLFWSGKNAGIKIDYGKMRDKLVKGRTLIRPYFYCDSYVECKASDKSLCTRKVPTESFCPFYDSAKMSWFGLQLFLIKENTLVAVRRLDDLDAPLRGFLESGTKKDARSVQCI